MQNTKTGTTWAPDISPESIETFTETYTPEGGEEQTVTYKRVADHPILSGIRDKLAFFMTHAGAVWYNKLANRTVADEIRDLNAKMPSDFGVIKTVKQNGSKTINANAWAKVLSLTLEPGTYIVSGQLDVIGQLNTNKYIAINDASMNYYSTSALPLSIVYLEVTSFLTLTSAQEISASANSTGESADVYNGILTALKIK